MVKGVRIGATVVAYLDDRVRLQQLTEASGAKRAIAEGLVVDQQHGPPARGDLREAESTVAAQVHALVIDSHGLAKRQQRPERLLAGGEGVQ